MKAAEIKSGYGNHFEMILGEFYGLGKNHN